ncbi:uncharacterized protein LOC123262316 [Cotesia glomerata]|uniref:uncharacterized protein LOC123262316 n=1 Tax=Cotesia glomerata TaxID=32391 RepID=UPI001D02F432|nr:uncharacterized protein LOC123262316 [Cotesia glomerata]
MRRDVLRLYKDLLRYGDNLKFTHKKYFKSRVKQDFYDNLELNNPNDIQFCLEKGRELLSKKKVI